MGKKRRSERGKTSKLIPSPSKKARRARSLAGKWVQRRKLRHVLKHNGPVEARKYADKHGLPLAGIIRVA